MVPLVKKSTTTLVEKFGEKAESGESIELMRLVVNPDTYYNTYIPASCVN